MDEVRKAVDMGYGLVEVFEFWEYKITCFDKDTNFGGLFAQCVNKSLKLKHESSGYQSRDKCEEDNDRYIEDFRRAERNALEYASIYKHAGQRTLVKLKLNSIWGK